MNRFVCLLSLVSLPLLAADPALLIHAHAHNDYEHARPLLDALDHGFCGVEADVWLVNGQLLVAHDRQNAKPERTLAKLYLDPLRERAVKNGGCIYRGGPPLTLLIDIKSDATNTYVVLRDTLKRYEKILTRFHANKTATNALTVIISGNRPRELMATEEVRFAAYDGRVTDLDGPASSHFMPLVSDNWTKHFKWRGLGQLPEDERQKLKQLVEKTHLQGKQLRLWGTPDGPAGWSELLAAGVDWINTDDLGGFHKFAGEVQPRAPR